MKRKKRYRYINGVKGAISLFLVVCVSPFLTIALLLVESARYQSAVGMMDEVIGSSMFATLADYDSYLDERFGLLALSQEISPNTAFGEYMSYNTGLLGGSVTVESQNMEGVYPLTNTAVLKQQLIEYGEISVLAEVVTEGIDLEDLLDKFRELFHLDEINKDIEAVTAGVDAAKEVEKLVEGITDAKKDYDEKYAPALSAYITAYQKFEDKVTDLASALAEAEENLEEGEGQDKVYEDDDVKASINALNGVAGEYKEAASKLKSELSTIQKDIDDIFSALKALPGKLHDFDTKSAADQCSTSVYDWLNGIAEQVATVLDSTVGADYKDKTNAEKEALEDQMELLSVFSQDLVGSDWDSAKVYHEYGPVDISTIGSVFADNLNNLLDTLTQMASVDESTSNKLGNLLDIVGELFGLSVLYDANLDSVVSPSNMYASTTMSLSSQMSITSLTALVSAGREFMDSINSFGIITKVVKVAKAMVKLLEAIVTFLVAVVSWVGETLVNLAQFVMGGPQLWYDNILLYGYGAYNLPNRTTYKTEKTLSGYKYSDIFDLAGGQYRSAGLMGSLESLSNIGSEAGTDEMFKGAEAEYLLVGSASELVNQSVSFFDLYMLRMVLDIYPIMKNPQVMQIASLAGPCAWIVKIVIILAEPMLDTIILVNGGKEYLVKDTVYMSYSGLIFLANDLVDVTVMGESLKDKIKDTIKTGGPHNQADEEGLFDATYSEHLLLLMLLSISQETFLQRLQNLIQTEARCKYKDEYEFRLGETYTYANSNVVYRLNPFIQFDSLTDHGLFRVTKKKYMGY